MRWLRWLLLISILGAAGVGLWLKLHPSPAQIIRTQLRNLASQASFPGNESDLTRLAKIAGITRFFAPEVEMKVAFRDFAERGTLTHESIQLGAGSLRQYAPAGLHVEFLDVNVSLAPGATFATAELTMKTTTPGDNQFNVQEMKIALRHTNDVWLIYRVETVRTLK